MSLKSSPNPIFETEINGRLYRNRFKKGDSQLIKELNQVRILNLIRTEGPISRIELARRTKISKVAISEIINRLSDAGYVIEVGKGKSTHRGGKRPTLLRINPENGFVIGIEVKRSASRIALANLESNIIGIEQIEYEPGAPTDKVIPLMFSAIDSLLTQNRIEPERLVSIGIGIPGLIDYQHGALLFADTLGGWREFSLTSAFSERYGVPTIIENDVNTITLGETLLGAGRDELDLVCLWIGEGIGAGIVVNGQLIQGIRGGAGEIGYLEIGYFLKDRNICPHLYKKQRKFGEILSELYLHKCLQETVNPDNPNISSYSLEQLLQLGEKGDKRIREILDEYAALIHLLCLHLIMTINPNALILSGKVIEHSPYLFNKIKNLLEETALKSPFQVSRVVPGELNAEACLKGAIAVALQTLYEPPLTNNFSHVRYLT